MRKLINLRKVFLFLSTFFLIYLFISITNYTWINYNTYRGYSSLIENYLLRYKEELKNNLYEKTFSSVQECLLPDNSYDEKCLDKVRKALEQVICEEELGFQTPSLFFALK
ncbi:MAG: hypothetical protein KatS3mg090_0422 [Patescibacteria group bacterium]|nr:MAG: hypothetical protein KatS3mg090_0422 [Patescibacteria group bacterium]